MLFVLNGAGPQAELKCAVMACIKPAGGEYIRIDALRCQTALLEGGQVAKFCAELKKRSDDAPMYHSANDDLLFEIIVYLDTHRPGSLLIFGWGDSAFIFEPDPARYDFNGILAAKDEAVAAITKLVGEVRKLRNLQAAQA